MNNNENRLNRVIKPVIIWLRQMTHADWLISGLEKVILPAQESHRSCPLKKFILPARINIAKIKF